MSVVLIIGLFCLLAGLLIAFKALAAPPAEKAARPRAAVVLFSHFPEDARPRREAEALIHAGFDVELICLQRDRSEQLREELPGLVVYRVPLRRKRNGKLSYVLLYGVFFLAAATFLGVRALRGYRLVHVHNMPDILVFSALLPRLFGARILLDLHDPMPELFQAIYKLPEESCSVGLLKRIEHAAIRFSDAVLTPNVAFKDLFASRGAPPQKVNIVMNSPDEALFNMKAADQSQPLPGLNVAFHGTLVERNGLGLAVEAVGLLAPRLPELRLHIFGEQTGYSQEVFRRVAEMKLENVIHYHGFKPLNEVPASIAQMDFGLVPNVDNVFTRINLPTRILECLSMGKPPVAPRTRGVLDYFQEKDLIFFEPGNAHDLANQLEWAYRHPEEVAAILRRGRQVYERHRWVDERGKFVEIARKLGRLADAAEGSLEKLPFESVPPLAKRDKAASAKGSA
ncbi:MAG TPA: glycosyltransferase family 4 protein [Verrucomicrobiae bacterium]|nr:glycosyltransferase family 4 protein [Verrucomicrobiae bacterium]